MGSCVALNIDIPANAFAMEAPAGARLVQGPKTSLPGVVQPDGRFLIRAVLNGKETSFLVDTGASMTVLRSEDALIAGITPYGRRSLRGVGGMVEAQRATARTLIVGENRIQDVDVVIVDGLPVSLLGMDVLGQLGTFRLDFSS